LVAECLRGTTDLEPWSTGVCDIREIDTLGILYVCIVVIPSSWLTIAAGNYREVIRSIFSCISLLRTSIPYLPPYFEEFKKLSEISFRNREKSQPHTYVISLTRRLEEDPPAQWLLNADSLYREYSEAAMKDVLDCLLPEKARLVMSAKDHGNLAETSQIDWQKERWYGTEYAVQKFSSDILEKVSSCVMLDSAERSLKYLAGSHPRVAPPTSQSLHSKEFRGNPGWCFHGRSHTFGSRVKWS